MVDEDVAKVSIVGVGMRSHVGVASRMFDALAKNTINIEMIATREIRISCVVAEADGVRALQAVHQCFQLAKK